MVIRTNPEYVRQLESELFAANGKNKELEAKYNTAQERIHQFDRCIRAVADALEASACGGVDTDIDDPYGTTAVLVGRAKELADRVKVLTDAMHTAIVRFNNLSISVCAKELSAAIDATPQQTAEQIERWHIEWMMKLPVAAYADRLGSSWQQAYCIPNTGVPPWMEPMTKLVAIPPLPKE